MYIAGLWVQRLKDITVIKPQVKGLLTGLDFLQRFLKKNRIDSEYLKKLSKWKEKLDSEYEHDADIDKDDAKELSASTREWDVVITKELKEKHVIEMELESGLNPNELLKLANKHPSEFIAEGIWKKLTDIEKSDFSDAARCLLLGTATPSVMVGLRGAEASIRNYYHRKTNEEPGNKTWRQLTNELKTRTTELGIDDTFIGYLDYIGATKRNFAQHPHKVYSLREAVIVFMQVVGLIEDVYSQI